MELRGFPMPDEFMFLCMLHNIGATQSEKSLTIAEISRWAAMEPGKVKKNLQKLIETNYVQMGFIEGAERYYVTGNGIRKVLSIYS